MRTSFRLPVLFLVLAGSAWRPVPVASPLVGPTAAALGPAPVVLLRDDFDGGALNGAIWVVPVGVGTFLGRTQFRPPVDPPRVEGGAVRLRLDTFNPSARVAGDSFLGTEIVSRARFLPAPGLEFRAGVRLASAVPPGVVGAFFGYALRGATRDEVDFEFLATRPGLVLTNLFRGQGFDTGGVPIPAALPSSDGPVVVAMRWTERTVQWLVADRAVREEPWEPSDVPLTVRLNIWAPGPEWPEAYDPGLRPARAAAENRTCFFDIDYVEVSTMAGVSRLP